VTSSGFVLALPFLIGWISFAVAASPEVVPTPVTPQVSDAQAGWDQQAAARYLDDRMDFWFAKAKRLRTGSGTTSCIACHTVVPYSLARAALRKATGMNKPTTQETKLLDEIIRRVGTYAEHEPLYKSKEEQSVGTEAVLNLLLLASEDARQNRRAPSEPTLKALEELWKEQRPDGAWDWLDFGLEPYESTDSVYYGAALAGMAVGTVSGNTSVTDEKVSGHVARLRAYLNRNYSDQNLYNKVWMVLASIRLRGLLSREQTEALTKELERHQNADGGWSLRDLGPWTWSKTGAPFEPEGKPDTLLLSKSDAYATGLITYAVRQSGLAADHPALKRALAWLKSNQREYQIDQNRWKCWRAYSLNDDREHGGEGGEAWKRMFMSDGATAFAVLALLQSD